MMATTERSENQCPRVKQRRPAVAAAIIAMIAIASLAVDGFPKSSSALAESPAVARAEDKACVIFFEGNRCSVGFDRGSCCTQSGAFMRGCWKNDEARSMKVYGPAGTVITVFDSPKATTDDDYFVLIKGTDEPVCVASFETPHVSLEGSPNVWFYSGGNGLDGKVSTFRWADPRHQTR